MVPTNGMVSYSSPAEGGSYIFGTVPPFPALLVLASVVLRLEHAQEKMMPTWESLVPVQHVLVSIYDALMNAHVLVLLIPCFFSQQSPALFLLN